MGARKQINYVFPRFIYSNIDLFHLAQTHTGRYRTFASHYPIIQRSRATHCNHHQTSSSEIVYNCPVNRTFINLVHICRTNIGILNDKMKLHAQTRSAFSLTQAWQCVCVCVPVCLGAARVSFARIDFETFAINFFANQICMYGLWMVDIHIVCIRVYPLSAIHSPIHRTYYSILHLQCLILLIELNKMHAHMGQMNFQQKRKYIESSFWLHIKYVRSSKLHLEIHFA